MTEPREDDDERYGPDADYDDVYDGDGNLVKNTPIPAKNS